jgi:hypothetical protein
VEGRKSGKWKEGRKRQKKRAETKRRGMERKTGVKGIYKRRGGCATSEASENGDERERPNDEEENDICRTIGSGNGRLEEGSNEKVGTSKGEDVAEVEECETRFGTGMANKVVAEKRNKGQNKVDKQTKRVGWAKNEG